ncbi:MAG: HEAT repeat domain-containing protein [Planctomycetota bacterium]
MEAAIRTPVKGKKKGALLLELLECEDPYLRNEAAYHFLKWGEEAAPYVPALIRALDDPAASPMAILALARVGTKANSALPYLERIAGLKGAPNRRAALIAMGQIDPTGEVALPVLMKLLESEEGSVATGAAMGLGHLGPRAAPAVDALIRRLDSKNASLRYGAIEALGLIGPAAAPAISRLEAIAKSKVCARHSPSIIAAARKALDRIRKGAARSDAAK